MTPTSRRSSEPALPVDRVRYASIAGGALVLMLVVTRATHAASILDFDNWMQRIEKRALSMQRNMKRGNGAAGAADAREIEELYRLMQAWFEQAGNAEEAVQISRRGREFAALLATRSAAGQFEDARETVRSLMRDCQTCHREYKPLS